MTLRQKIYRIISLIAITTFSILIAIDFNNFHTAFHSVSILGGILIVASFYSKEKWLIHGALIALTVFCLAGVYTDFMFGGYVSNWGYILFSFSIVFLMLSILEIIENKLLITKKQ